MLTFQKDVYKNAVDHGFWDCKRCDGTGEYLAEVCDPDVEESFANAVCPQCGSTGLHREDAESLALIHAEVSEALEALRDAKNLKHCTKCEGKKFVLIDKKFENGEVGPTAIECPKCEGSGEALGGSRFAEELSDVYIRLLDLAEHHGINLDKTARAKHAYNVTRPHKHGKAF
jgi:hypothetical protein